MERGSGEGEVAFLEKDIKAKQSENAASERMERAYPSFSSLLSRSRPHRERERSSKVEQGRELGTGLRWNGAHRDTVHGIWYTIHGTLYSVHRTRARRARVGRELGEA